MDTVKLTERGPEFSFFKEGNPNSAYPSPINIPSSLEINRQEISKSNHYKSSSKNSSAGPNAQSVTVTRIQGLNTSSQ